MSWWRKTQKGGDHSSLVQAEVVENHIHYHAEAPNLEATRELCLLLVHQELDKYSLAAQQIIEQRVAEFAENYFNEQNRRAPEGFERLNDPAMQRALRTAQIEFASSGSINLGEMLVDILVALSTERGSTIRSIALTEALTAAPKLTKGQVDALALLVVVTLTNYNKWMSLNDMYSAMKANVVPFVENLPGGGMGYRHMQSAGVGWVSFASRHQSLPALLLERYPGFFTHGFWATDVPEALQPHIDSALFIPAFRNPDRLQLAYHTPGVIDGHSSASPSISKISPSLRSLQAVQLMSPEEVQADLIEHIPEMEQLFKIWETSNIGSFELTTSGIVIGHANWDSRTSNSLPLELYFPESE